MITSYKFVVDAGELNGFKNITSRVVGRSDEVDLQERIFNAGTFSAMLVALLITVNDTFHHIGTISNFYTLLVSVLFGVLYFYGRRKGINNFLIISFGIVGVLAMVYDWYFFHGLKGSAVLIALTIACLIPAVGKGKIKAFFIFAIFATLTTIFCLEYFDIHMVGSYPSDKDHIADLYMTGAILMVGIIFLVSFVVNSHSEQKHRADELNKKLEEANAMLEESLQVKNKFFSIISHDLRGPVGALNSLGQMLMENESSGVVDQEDREMIVSSIQVSSKQALELLDNLLYWARTETGQLRPKLEQLQVSELAKESLSLLMPNVTAKNLAVTLKGNSGLLIHADREMVRLILRNLLSNAIKFTPTNGKIEVSHRLMGSFIELRVADNGIGIPEKDISSLFKLESNVTRIGTSQEKGTGLGLKLCKQFVDKNGGTIRVDSQVNKGTTFIVCLPAYNLQSTLSVN